MKLRILFILLVVSETYSERKDECADNTGISVRWLERDTSAVEAYATFTPSENITFQYLVTGQQNSALYCTNVSIDITEINNTEPNRIFLGLSSGENFTDSIQSIPLNISGAKSTGFGTPLSWEDNSNDTICAPLKVGGLKAEVTNQVWEICHVIVSWKKACVIPDFFSVSIISEDVDSEGLYFQIVSGRAIRAEFFNVTISREFNVSIKAWESGGRVDEIVGGFSKPKDTLVITALIIVVFLPFVYIAYAYFGYGRQIQRQKKTEFMEKAACIEAKSYAVLSGNDALQ